MLNQKDSVFSPYLTEYFPDDQTITPVKEIKAQLDKVESAAKSLFIQTYQNAVDNAIVELSQAIANQEIDKVKKYQWNLPISLSNNLFGEWMLGWQQGAQVGQQEIAQQISFSQPPAESAILRNRAAEEAIKTRVNTLARDVSASEWEAIKKDILAAIAPQSRTENPISRAELLKRINQKLGDRAQRYQDRAETIARTELTFAYNAGRLDSYVRSDLVAGVRFSTIFDKRRCDICASRQGIIVDLDDFEQLAKLAIPVHPRCRCVWSPVLKTEFDDLSKQPGRKISERKLIGGKPWLAGAILAAILIPEELILGGLALGAIAKLVSKTGSKSAARAFVASKINAIGRGVSSAQKGKTTPSLKQSSFIAPGINLDNITPQQLRQFVPNLTDAQISRIILKQQDKNKAFTLQVFSTIVDKKQFQAVRAIARQNYLFDLLDPAKNLTPSALWVNSGGIIPKNKTKPIFQALQNGIGSEKELINLMQLNNVDYTQLKAYAVSLFDRDYPV